MEGVGETVGVVEELGKGDLGEGKVVESMGDSGEGKVVGEHVAVVKVEEGEGETERAGGDL